MEISIINMNKQKKINITIEHIDLMIILYSSFITKKKKEKKNKILFTQSVMKTKKQIKDVDSLGFYFIDDTIRQLKKNFSISHWWKINQHIYAANILTSIMYFHDSSMNK